MRIKKFVCAAAAVLCVGVVAASAEVQPNAIGLRFTGGNLTAYEINYQKALGLFGSNRLEVGVMLPRDSAAFSIVAIAMAQWHWNIAGGFNWYVGPGVGAGLSSDALYVGVGGQIGIEYDFNALGVPLNLSIDSRPMIDVLHLNGFAAENILYGSISIRYTF